MPLFRVTIDATEEQLLYGLKLLMRKSGGFSGKIVGFHREGAPLDPPLVSPEESRTTRDFGGRNTQNPERDAEIISAYTNDPKANSTCKLGVKYSLSRERICQILRPVNAIGNAQARRESAREAHKAASEKLKTETITLWESKFDEAVGLIKNEGISVRQAAARIGMPPHSNFTNYLSKRARLAGVEFKHGRHRDFSKRCDRVRELSAQRFTIPEIVRRMRAEDDPHIHANWVYQHVPEARVRPKQPRKTPVE